MPYKKEGSVYKFRVKYKGWPKKGTLKDTKPDGSKVTDADLLLFEAELLKKCIDESKIQAVRSLKVLKFEKYIDLYVKSTGKHAQTSLVKDLREALGSIEIKTKTEPDGNKHLDFEPVERAFYAFMEEAEVRPKRGIEGKLLSPATLQGYRRYFCCICSHGEKLLLSAGIPRIPRDWNPANSVVVGEAEERFRPITDIERKKYFDAIINTPELHWFLPIWRFASTMPIRPDDQCKVPVKAFSQDLMQLKYVAGKTKKPATPAVLPHMRSYLLSRVEDSECLFVFYRTGYVSRKQDPKKHYPIGYWGIKHAHDRICEIAGIQDLRFYDWRHDAVNFLLSAGFEDDQIMKFAGWCSPDMIRKYDTYDRERLAKVTQEILEKGNKTILEEIAVKAA